MKRQSKFNKGYGNKIKIENNSAHTKWFAHLESCKGALISWLNQKASPDHYISSLPKGHENDKNLLEVSTRPWDANSSQVWNFPRATKMSFTHRHHRTHDVLCTSAHLVSKQPKTLEARRKRSFTWASNFFGRFRRREKSIERRRTPRNMGCESGWVPSLSLFSLRYSLSCRSEWNQKVVSAK